METGKWTEYVIGMEKPSILQNTGVPSGGALLAARRRWVQVRLLCA